MHAGDVGYLFAELHRDLSYQISDRAGHCRRDNVTVRGKLRNKVFVGCRSDHRFHAWIEAFGLGEVLFAHVEHDKVKITDHVMHYAAANHARSDL